MKTLIEVVREVGFSMETSVSVRAAERFAELVRADERERIYFQTSSDFVKAAIAEEREACAKLCEEIGEESDSFTRDILRSTATAIRARSNT